MKKALLFLFLTTITACADSGHDKLYNACVESGVKEQMADMEESDKNSVKIRVEKACSLLITECEKTPDSDMCKAFKTKFNAQ